VAVPIDVCGRGLLPEHSQPVFFDVVVLSWRALTCPGTIRVIQEIRSEMDESLRVDRPTRSPLAFFPLIQPVGEAVERGGNL